MKKNKKSLIALLFLTFIFLILNVSAEDNTYTSSISVNNQSVEVGDKKIEVNFSLKTVTESSCTVNYEYDTSKLTYNGTDGADEYNPSSSSFKFNKSTTNASAKVYFDAIAGGNAEVKIKSVTCNGQEITGTPASTTINIKSPDLSGISISNGTLSPAFDANVTEYTAVLTVEKTTISAALANSDMKLSGNGDYSLNIDEEKVVNLVVTAKNGTKKTYKINLTRPASVNKSNNNNLEYISFNGKKISDFDKNTVIYKLDVKNSIENADIKYKVEDSKATATLTGPEKLSEGENTYKITVTAEDGSIKEYSIIITRAKEKNTVEYSEEKILEEIENGVENNIYVTVEEDEKIKTVDKSILKKLKETKKIITYEVVNSENELLYSITINGKNIKDTSKVLNFNMTFKSNYKTLIDKLANNKELIYLNFSNDIELPGEISVKVFVSDKFKNGKKLYLYYYNEKDNKLENIAKNLTVKSGYVEFTLEHTSEYVLSDTDFDAKESDEKTNFIFKFIIPVAAGLLAMIVFVVVALVIKKKKNKNPDAPKKEKKKNKKEKKKKKTKEEPLEETSTLEENQDLEKTIQIDVPNTDNQIEGQSSNENLETQNVENMNQPNEEKVSDTETSNDDKSKNEEVEILDLDDPNSKN